ncbi:DNA kinase/phosphatase Pnk1 [Schizosaccharomyces cryophilus OY26]|uniref:DNA kinase/phosphatase Pnk1 n=1 Tax=Schizosaccharomyces cryophilus (strain OY26 / ATCC MYA-4695 / CBS 11777 / NBRC 106824 / NRRL Y48691) TaxID=653667 RepID=S9VZQ9_SCHCR|nr:DNA kinase/phosphatase Pnk1 [Schizosaccharomyces cryophilus OY26]EPY51749.1 DNA kinase/phosphatase Pnk1 [Schizosaccharomyces cryophilus OY26]
MGKRKLAPQSSINSYFDDSEYKKQKNKDPTVTDGKLTWEITESLYIATYGKPKKSEKVATFDLDGTLIKTKSGRVFAKDAGDWLWWHPNVVPTLKKLDSEGFSIVIFSNQNGIPRRASTGHQFQIKVRAILESLDLPVILYAALLRDKYRKPLQGMWDHFVERWAHPIDKSLAFFVGDAAGRPRNHNSTDLKFAENIGIKFDTPEHFFTGEPFDRPDFSSFHPKMFLQEDKTSQPYKFVPAKHQEIVVLVGYPASGKSTLCESQIVPFGYQRVNQDALKTKARCVKAAVEALKNNKSVVIDNTSPTYEAREVWVKLAKEFNVPARCIYLEVPEQLAKHNNTFRYIQQEIKGLPEVAYVSFRSKFQKPSVKEGFESVESVPFRCLPELEEKWNQWYE